MRNVLRDPSLEKEFQREGYVKTDLLTSEEVEQLKNSFFELQSMSGGSILESDLGGDSALSYDFSFIDKSIDYKRAVYDVITKLFQPHVNNLLQDYRPIIANYIRKKQEAGEVPLHQNWAFVEEKKCTSVSIWCPLVDSTEENGTLQVVPRSHKRFGEHRGPMVPWELDNIKEEIINNYLVPIEAQAGQCVIIDDSIVHYSAVNNTSDLRLAIQLILIPSEFPSIHYHMDPSKPEQIDVLEVDKEFYMEFNPWAKPKNVNHRETIDYNHDRFLTEEEFARKLKGKRFDEQPESIFEKIRAVFS